MKKTGSNLARCTLGINARSNAKSVLLKDARRAPSNPESSVIATAYGANETPSPQTFATSSVFVYMCAKEGGVFPKLLKS